MGFVQTGFLSALVAIAVPIIIHLVLGRRARRVDLGTLRFLRIALSQNARRKRLKRWLLLALRIAAVSLLAVLFARPLLLAAQCSGADRLVLVLIDQSGSMGLQRPGGTALERAVDRAKQIVGSCGRAAQLQVAFFDHRVHPVTGETGDSTAMVDVLDEQMPKACFSTTEYGAAMDWARDRCVQSARLYKDVYLITDLQRCGLGQTVAEPFPPEARVHVIDVGQPYPRNAAVTGVASSKTIARPGERITVGATVFNASQFALEEVPVVLHLEHGQRQHNWRQQVNLQPGTSQTVQFQLQGLQRGLWQGYAMIELDDELAFDNRRYLAVLVAPPIEVLVVDGDPAESLAQSETYFLQAALRLAPPGESFPDSPYAPRVVRHSEEAGLPALSSAAVVLANVPSLSPQDARRLARFVESGGGLLVFAGDRVHADFYGQLAGAGIGVGNPLGRQPAGVLPWRLGWWDREHPVFRLFDDPQHGDLQRLAFRCFVEIKPAEAAKVLARFQDGSPALVERLHGRGRVLWFASACDSDWSQWPRSRLFVPLVHQMLGYLVGLAEGGPVRSRLVNEYRAGKPVAKPGVYDRGRYFEVVNVDPKESETERTTVADLARHFRFTPVAKTKDAETDITAAGTAGRQLRPNEIWHWALLALLAILFVEGVLANRTTV